MVRYLTQVVLFRGYFFNTMMFHLKNRYRLAVPAKGKIVLSPPYIDAGTEKVVLTLGKAIFK